MLKQVIFITSAVSMGTTAPSASACFQRRSEPVCCVLSAATLASARPTACLTWLLFHVESKMQCCANIFLCKTLLLNTVFYAERANLLSASLSCIQSNAKPDTQQKYVNPVIEQVSPFFLLNILYDQNKTLNQEIRKKSGRIDVTCNDISHTFYIYSHICMLSHTVHKPASSKRLAFVV
jgi:hypothetical protein